MITPNIAQLPERWMSINWEFSIPKRPPGANFNPPTLARLSKSCKISPSMVAPSIETPSGKEDDMKIVVNGKTTTIPKEYRDVRLLDFIRDYIGLKGTKYGCGKGLCGACTVHIDGVATRSCITPLARTEGRNITTIEGLSGTTTTGSLHPVQKAWIEDDVPQCGYCQSGQIMTAAALLRRNPDPTIEEIRDEMAGNLCRCGTYDRIQRAISRASKEVGK